MRNSVSSVSWMRRRPPAQRKPRRRRSYTIPELRWRHWCIRNGYPLPPGQQYIDPRLSVSTSLRNMDAFCCPVCGARGFYYRARTSGQQRIYCSNACKQKAYRWRKGQHARWDWRYIEYMPIICTRRA